MAQTVLMKEYKELSKQKWVSVEVRLAGWMVMEQS